MIACGGEGLPRFFPSLDPTHVGAFGTGSAPLDKRIADMKLAKDFAMTMEEFRKLQSLAIQRETTYKPVVPQNAQSK